MRGPQPLATGVSSAAKMPIKDYFEVQEVDEEVLTEEAKHAKVIEFVYQVRYHVRSSQKRGQFKFLIEHKSTNFSFYHPFSTLKTSVV